VNIHHVRQSVLGIRQITLYNTATNNGTNVEGVETVIHEHFLFKNVCIWWIPKMLTFDQKMQCVAVSAEHLHHFELEGNTFLE
jgi:hypothetical protein